MSTSVRLIHPCAWPSDGLGKRSQKRSLERRHCEVHFIIKWCFLSSDWQHDFILRHRALNRPHQRSQVHNSYRFPINSLQNIILNGYIYLPKKYLLKYDHTGAFVITTSHMLLFSSGISFKISLLWSCCFRRSHFAADMKPSWSTRSYPVSEYVCNMITHTPRCVYSAICV